MNADQHVAKIARRIRFLGALSWPVDVEKRFLERYHAGCPELPRPPAVEADLTLDEPLVEVVRACDRQDPLQDFVARTAEGYRQLLALLAASGTETYFRHSRLLFGAPTDPLLPGESHTLLDEAEHLLATVRAVKVDDPTPTLSAPEARDWLQERVDPIFDGTLPVVLDPKLVSLAAAGAGRIRIRDGVLYAEEQLEQLLQHEAFVHSLTKRNGREQPRLSCLGLSSPRTLAVQEGLATLAEMITDTLDLSRLRRIALRVCLIAKAREGADFLDIFRYLLDEGADEQEAFRSSMRIFRGGDMRGRSVLTKDVVYLKGLRRVHSFLLAALRDHQVALPEILFAGRMTCGDAVRLAPLMGGLLQPPARLPRWVRRRSQLASYLSWAAFGQRVAAVPLQSFT